MKFEGLILRLEQDNARHTVIAHEIVFANAAATTPIPQRESPDNRGLESARVKESVHYTRVMLERVQGSRPDGSQACQYQTVVYTRVQNHNLLMKYSAFAPRSDEAHGGGVLYENSGTSAVRLARVQAEDTLTNVQLN